MHLLQLFYAPRIFATVMPSRKVSPVSTQFIKMMLSTSELMAKLPIIDDIPSISGFSWLYTAAIWCSFISAMMAWKKSRNTRPCVPNAEP